MTRQSSFTHLRNTLAEFYPNEADLRRLLADARIDATRIPLNASALNNWQAICSEAEKTNQMAALLDVVLAEYGENVRVRTAVADYRRDGAQTVSVAPPASSSGWTWQRISLGAMISVLLALIGLWADVLSIGSWLRPAPTPTSPAVVTIAPTVPSSQPFVYGVTVRNATGQTIPNAEVRIEVADKAPLHEYSDSNGFARLIIPALLAQQPGRLTVTADGYVVMIMNIDLRPDQLPQEVRLQN